MKVWDYYGRNDPYYGVMSAPEFKSGRVDDATLQLFFSSGVADVAECIEIAQRSFGPLHFATALDYGCGVGRLSRPLAERFSRVIAVDLSQDMLERARQGLQGLNVSYESAGSMTAERTNFILSRMVFQHIPPSIGVPILSKLAARLDGTGIIEVPIRDKASALRRALRIGRRVVKSALPLGAPTIPMYTYDLERAVAALEGCTVKVERLDTPMFEQARLIFHSMSSAHKH
jgi:2-polyprenyl-3-methyl-5-hydroxy-6-metoxy-1,4-benzoquinol methylase